MTLEMELIAILFNFGIVGLILYVGPFLYILYKYVNSLLKGKRKLTVDTTLALFFIFVCFGLSLMAGYVLFSTSCTLILVCMIVKLFSEENKIIRENERKKIVFGITSLRLGGAERVLVDICNKLVNEFDITIFTLYGNGEFTKQIDSKIKIVNYTKKRYEDLSTVRKKIMSIKLLLKPLRIRIYEKFIKDKYDVEISFLEGPITWLFACNGNAKKIAWVHIDIENMFGHGMKSKFKYKLNNNSYQSFNDIIFVSKDNMNVFKEVFPKNKSNKRVIYNFIDKDAIIEKGKKEAIELNSQNVNFLQISRLVDQKAIIRLIDVHKRLIDDKLYHNIFVVGDGPLREEIENKIKKYHISDTFILLGQKTNPYPYLKACDYFLLSSYYEGYPMVLLEAKIYNKYCIITDTAAREVIEDYPNSLIVENSENGIYDGMKKIIESKPKAKQIKIKNTDKLLQDIIELIEE